MSGNIGANPVVTTSVSSLLIFVSEEVAVAVETIPEMHNDRVERI
ncbi:hypothetical protein ECP02989426_2199 [Escherichia coli P0298942.6]|nr:hypothetical protein EC2845350_2344 [Escherichia coli 2845350]ENA99627.1 hypothetical protein EC2862600_2147 [Escherichia coli 2862600]ENB17074.1 hypothetical protein EC2875150_5415 [Escherichia coli 2875150]ENB48540.1 hypothetical protein ECP029894211_2230 [Escherichia coli P0298942.11]ENB62708.1 hypothetical protein ECP029894215_2274 [Escherichia coli P0298942.15]ENB63159.1 hypothetical protein ECP02989426_2199 [Escherichia coli P0298942.6]ENB78783.1 hypothetical protein ECP02989427_2192